MSERKVVLDESELSEESGNALRQAEERANRAEAELARMKASAHAPGETSGAGDMTASSQETERRVQGSSSGDSEARREATARVAAGDDASATKQPPSPSTAEGQPGVAGGEAELRKDSMMAHLLDSLAAGKDIGHYGRLVFAMVARHFLPHDEVLAWMTKDRDFSEEDARLMLRQVEGKDYSPPKRARLLEWQSQQEFPILPDPEDPDCGNLYRTLRFPEEIYEHIGHYQEQKMEAEER